jgi:hypothetical protein
LRLVFGGYTYIAITADGSSLGERELPKESSPFSQEAVDDPMLHDYLSCVGRMHF